jgi:hypothetical protein
LANTSGATAASAIVTGTPGKMFSKPEPVLPTAVATVVAPTLKLNLPASLAGESTFLTVTVPSLRLKIVQTVRLLAVTGIARLYGGVALEVMPLAAALLLWQVILIKSGSQPAAICAAVSVSVTVYVPF